LLAVDQALGVSRNTVNTYVQTFREHQLSWQQFEELLSENNNAVKSEIKDVGFSENKNVGILENSDACF
jgi:endonuclease III